LSRRSTSNAYLFMSLLRRHTCPTLFPYTTLFRSLGYDGKSKLPLIAVIHGGPTGAWQDSIETWGQLLAARGKELPPCFDGVLPGDRKSTRLNSSHVAISYAVFCLKKKKKKMIKST